MALLYGKWHVRVAEDLSVQDAPLDWHDAQALMAWSGGEGIKTDLKERQVHRIKGRNGGLFYLKRVFHMPWGEALRARMSRRGFSRPAREWRALRRLHELGVPAPEALVCGERRVLGLTREAFLVTRALSLCCSLEELLKSGRMKEHWQDFSLQIVHILRAMHAGGLNHRDFYLGHLFLGADLKTVHVLDLDRADCREHVPLRWRVKDLAALHFSTPTASVGTFARLRFLRRYLGEPLRDHRSLLRAIELKAVSMRAHVSRRIAQGQANYHLNE